MIRYVMVAAVVLVATVAGSFAALSAIGAQSSNSVDVSAALLLPADLDTIGLDDYGTGVGVTGGPVALVTFDRTYRGAGADDRRFASADGLEFGAALYLLDRSVVEQPARVLSSVLVYADADAASAAFDAISAARLDVAAESDLDAADDTDADAAATFVIAGVAPYDDQDFRQTSVVARTGSALIEVAIERQDGTSASVDDVAALLPPVLSRLADAGERAESLGVRIPEITGTGVLPSLSRYVVRAGEAIPQYAQSDEDAEAQAATFAAFETSEVFQFGYTVAVDGPLVGGFVSRHDSDDAARAYFRAIPDLLASNDRYDDVRVGNAIVRAGDSATVVTYGIAGDDGIVVTEVIVLLGDVVAELIVNATDAVSTDDTTTFAQSVEACVTGDDCQPLTVPDDAGFGTD